jgi:hypothetical protein
VGLDHVKWLLVEETGDVNLRLFLPNFSREGKGMGELQGIHLQNRSWLLFSLVNCTATFVCY